MIFYDLPLNDATRDFTPKYFVRKQVPRRWGMDDEWEIIRSEDDQLILFAIPSRGLADMECKRLNAFGED